MISYAITVCNELEEIKRLISFLLEKKRIQDEIVVVFDEKNGSEDVREYLKSIGLRWYSFDFKNDFSLLKNYLISCCSVDNIVFQIDADEIPNEFLIENLPQIIESNPNIDVFLIPRENFVEGISKYNEWGWEIDEKGRNCFPDFQWRIFKNNGQIRYKNKVHEVLTGYNSYSILPAETEYSLLHIKTLSKQRLQNQYYSSL